MLSRLAYWKRAMAAALVREYFPQADQRFQWARTPLAALSLTTVFALAAGLFVATHALALAAALLGLIGVGMLWPWLAMRGIRCSIEFASTRGCEDVPVEATVVVHNRSPWPAWGLYLADEAASGEDAPIVAFARVAGWTRSRFSWRFTPDCRGVYPRKSLEIRSAFPFGVWTASRVAQVEKPVIVWPRTVPLATRDWASRGTAGAGRVVCARAGDAGGRLGSREYRPGDALRNVHWPLTARFNQVFVHEHHSHADGVVRVGVNLSTVVHVGAGPAGTREWAIRIAASVVRALSEQGVEAELEVGESTWSVAPAPRSLRWAYDHFAQVDCETRPHAAQRRPDMCDAMSISITTDLDTAARGSSAPSNRAYWIVIDTRAFSDDATAEHRHCSQVRADNVVVIDDPGDPLRQLARHWRQIELEGRHAV